MKKVSMLESITRVYNGEDVILCFTYPQHIDCAFDGFCEFIEAIGLEYKAMRSRNYIEINGHKLNFACKDNLVGIKSNVFVFDELELYK